MQHLTTRIAIGIGAILFSSACQYSPDLRDRTVSFNKIQAETTSDILLLNIVRSSFRYPTAYSRIQSNSATAGLGPTTATIPLGSGLTSETDFGGATGAVAKTTVQAAAASLGLSVTESNVFTLQALDDQPSIEGVMMPINAGSVQYFWQEGWPPELLIRLFIERLEIDPKTFGLIEQQVASYCNASGDHFCSQTDTDDPLPVPQQLSSCLADVKAKG